MYIYIGHDVFNFWPVGTQTMFLVTPCGLRSRHIFVLRKRCAGNDEDRSVQTLCPLGEVDRQHGKKCRSTDANRHHVANQSENTRSEVTQRFVFFFRTYISQQSLPIFFLCTRLGVA